MNKTLFMAIAICSTLTTTASFAASEELQEVQTSWAQCQYNTPDKDEKEQCLNDAVQKNADYLAAHPNDPELTVWLAINKSTLAGAKGGLGALSLVKEAKELLESVIDRAPQTLEGSAYTSLGSLYYQVPGWPIGFGNDKEAEKMLKKALEINPNGIDPNYFYADFLVQDGRKEEAKQYFNRALQASPRPNRPLADEGRRMEIQAKLKELS
ncbi:tetratricopeptide repeat protein [Marinomonas communis]|uniref:tetratricopeptide repeat protein n=1 Tax=Marinomonas communis TaxID=28254 RepID=UPI001D18D8EB|nr:tetratricopeptide repeat protein [Marinomonas communis]MCC4274364.1 tetratricopeptide repeat protein [Marinomonas communis]